MIEATEHMIGDGRTRWMQWALIVLFLGGLSLPALLLFAGPTRDVSLVEKRKLAPLPEFSLNRASLASFPSRFEAYFNDHFGGRDSLIRLHHLVKVKWLKTSPVDKVLLGKDGWLFFTENRMVDSIRGVNPLSPEELAGVRRNLELRQTMLASFGVRYLLVLAPNKQSIYPEFLPDMVRPFVGPSRLDQIVTYMGLSSTVPILDLRPPLRKAGERELVYLTKDTHWNQRGAYVAYRSIMEVLGEWFPALTPPLAEDAVVQTREPSVRGDLADMLLLKHLMSEEAPFVRVKEPAAVADEAINSYLKQFDTRYSIDYQRPFARRSPKGTLRAMVFRDSFFTDVLPFIAENFSQSVYFYEPFNEELFYKVMFRQMKPDVVIEEVIERNL